MVTLLRNAGLVGFVTSPAVIVPLPRLVVAAAPTIGAAAATSDGSVTNTRIGLIAPEVGLINKRSPTPGAPLTTIDKPSATNGSPAVPVPVIGTAAPVSVRRKLQPPAVETNS